MNIDEERVSDFRVPLFEHCSDPLRTWLFINVVLKTVHSVWLRHSVLFMLALSVLLEMVVVVLR